jgi:hypothetical protein
MLTTAGAVARSSVLLKLTGDAQTAQFGTRKDLSSSKQNRQRVEPGPVSTWHTSAAFHSSCSLELDPHARRTPSQRILRARTGASRNFSLLNASKPTNAPCYPSQHTGRRFDGLQLHLRVFWMRMGPLFRDGRSDVWGGP